jgi:hypothetical protein
MILRLISRLEPGMEVVIDGKPWAIDSVRPLGDRIVLDLYDDAEERLGRAYFPDDLIEITI